MADIELVKLRQEMLRPSAGRGWASCSECGKSFPVWEYNQRLNSLLEVHHKKSRGSSPELRLVKSNCVLLCINCHRKIK